MDIYQYYIELHDEVKDPKIYEKCLLKLFPNKYPRTAFFNVSPRMDYAFDCYIRHINGVERVGSEIIMSYQHELINEMTQVKFDANIVRKVMAGAAASVIMYLEEQWCICFNCADNNGEYSMLFKMPQALYKRFLTQNTDLPGVKELLTELML